MNSNEDKIVIEYAKEVISKDDFTQRERAIYNKGYNDGINNSKLHKWVDVVIIVFLVLTVAVAIIINLK